MELFGIFALSITAAFAAAALRKYTPETAALIAVSAGAIILLAVLSKVSPVIGELQNLTGSVGIDASYGSVLIKTIGVCFLSQFTADACRDAGQSSLASKVELSAKITIVVLALPLMENILHIIAGLMGN